MGVIMKRLYFLTLVLLLIASTACNRRNLWSILNPGEDSPTATVTPQSGAWIARGGTINNTITVVFDATMDPASLSLTGTLGSTASIAWSTTTLTDDTLTIVPSASCPLGEGATLTINCNSMEVESITLSRTYNVAQSVYYVSAANTTGPWNGTRTEPMNLIQNAIDAASAAGIPGMVLVAEGTFSAAANMIILYNGISIYGGYSGSNWDVRNPATCITRLVDTRGSISGSTVPTDPARIIEVSTGATSSTVIDGFTLSIAGFVSGPSTPSAAAIYINGASPVISNNIITSPNVEGGSYSNTIGICHVNSGTPEIYNNTISLGIRGVTAANSSNHGIYCYNGAAPDIHGNSINAGESIGTDGTTFGIRLQNCAGNIYNNTLIHGGNGTAGSAGIHLIGSTTMIVNNDRISAASQTDAWGIRLESSSSPTIDGNILNNFSSPARVRCIHVASNSKPVISANYIDAGNNVTTYGIQINNEDTSSSGYTDIYNNIINAGQGTTTTGIEVYSVDTRLRIMNNIINGGGSGNFATAINLRRASLPGTDNVIIIANNNIFTDLTSASSYGVREFDNNSYPDMLLNNNIFHCGTLYFNFGATPDDLTNINDVNATILYAGVTPADNISEDIYTMLDAVNEYRFTGNLGLTDFDTNGLNLTAWGVFTTDRDGEARTVDWSIGSYEYD